jgi:peptidoglycan/LPS O-acetylase OafA/YrhL
MLSAQLAFSRQDRLPWRAFALASWLLVGALVWLGWGLHITAPRGAVLDTLVGVATALLLVSAARHPDGLTRRVLSIPLLARIGTFSYSIYLLHAPLLQLIWLYVLHPLGLSPRLTFALLVGLGGPAIVMASYVFFIFLERPFMSRRAPAAAVARQAVGS